MNVLVISPYLCDMLPKADQRFIFHSLQKISDINKLSSEVLNSIECLATSFSAGGTTDLFTQLPNLKLIAVYGAGYETIDIKYAETHKINVTNTPNELTADTADIALSLILSSARQIAFGDRFIRQGKWVGPNFPYGKTLTNKKLGIVGLGRIGQAIAKRASAFDLSISYFGRNEKPNTPYTYYNNLLTMAHDCQFLVVSCPGGKTTENIINKEILNALGEDGYLINISRGSTVNKEALIHALQNKIITGCGLDVYWDEPQVPNELLSLDNVTLLPHIGSATVETRQNMMWRMLENIESYFNHNQLLDPVLDFTKE